MGSIFFIIVLLLIALFGISRGDIDKKARPVIIGIVCIFFIPIIYMYIYKPYISTEGKQERLWKEQKEKTMEAMGIACYLKEDNTVRIRLKAECENWEKGKEIYAGVGNPDYFPDNISVESPELSPASR